MPKKRTLVFYYINENDGGLDSIYKEDGLMYWMCPSGISQSTFDAKEDAIWTALATAYKDKKDGLTIDRVSIVLLFAVFIWLALSAIAYIGSNGRYTYSLTILSLIIYISHISDKKS